MLNRSPFIFKYFQECLKVDLKKCEDIFDVETSYSNSVSTQLTIRNGTLMNIPLNLVVVGDLVILKPGQIINLNCKCQKDEEYFEAGKIYNPLEEAAKTYKKNRENNFESLASSLHQTNNDFNIRTLVNSCKFKSIPQCLLCVAMESPFLSHLK